jgi:hypothetical protein
MSHHRPAESHQPRHEPQETVPAGRPIHTPPYGERCRNPDACKGKGYCPLDPTCGD